MSKSGWVVEQMNAAYACPRADTHEVPWVLSTGARREGAASGWGEGSPTVTIHAALIAKKQIVSRFSRKMDAVSMSAIVKGAC